MKFRSRIILAYSIMVICLTVLIGLALNRYSIRRLQDSSKKDLAFIAENTSKQLDEFIYPMHFFSDFILSDTNTLSAINLLANASRSDTSISYLNQARASIQKSLITYCVNENFQRVNLFSTAGEFISSDLRTAPYSEDDYSHFDLRDSDKILIPPRPTSGSENAWVFSLISVVKGNYQPFYVEVQRSFNDLTAMLNLNGQNGIRLCVISEMGDVFFSDLTEYDHQILTDYLMNPHAAPANTDIISGHMLEGYYSSRNQLYTLALRNKADIQKEAAEINMITTICISLISSISIIYIFISLKRLNAAVKHEQHLTKLNTKAELDALQAQINPHFFYNILNIIASRAVINQDDELCSICGNLAEMMRYSTNIAHPYVLIREELNYVRNYLSLLSARYGEDMAVHISVTPEVESQQIPKIVLQQIVENAVNHGFRERVQRMEITIKGWIEKGMWYLEIADNGSGFQQKVLEELNQKISSIRNHTLDRGQAVPGIGGLGLINACIRVFLLFASQAVFCLENGENGGAKVIIGSYVKEEGGDSSAL